MIRRPPRSTLDRSSAASDVYKRQAEVAQKAAADTASSPQAMQRVQQQLDARRAELQAEITSLQRGLAARPKAQGGGMQARISQLQSELDLVNARRNLYS